MNIHQYKPVNGRHTYSRQSFSVQNVQTLLLVIVFPCNYSFISILTMKMLVVLRRETGKLLALGLMWLTVWHLPSMSVGRIRRKGQKRSQNGHPQPREGLLQSCRHQLISEVNKTPQILSGSWSLSEQTRTSKWVEQLVSALSSSFSSCPPALATWDVS